MVRIKSFRARRRFRDLDDALVNIAPGCHGKSGWVNIDAWPAPLVTCVYDCRKSLPFPDGSVRAIFCEHFLEHMDYGEEVPVFLSECRRVLKPTGVLRLIVPDAEKYLLAYVAGGWDELVKIRGLDENHRDSFRAYNTPMELINMVFRQRWQHKFSYDFTTLEFVLRKCGFPTVVRQHFGKSAIPELCLDRAFRAPESIYVEAMRS
jgi:predicted SAM-dependent methyltransferase